MGKLMPREGDLTNGHSSHAVTKSFISYWFEDTYLAGFFFFFFYISISEIELHESF